MKKIPLALKWRPRKINNLIGQNHIINILKNSLKYNRLHHSYLFTGPSGTGKTSLARIWAKTLNCKYVVGYNFCGICNSCKKMDLGKFVDYIEIDGANTRNVDEMSFLLENIRSYPVLGKFKIYLIDEFHMLSGHSLSLMLKILEEPPHYVKFILVTTDFNKIPVTIISRCIHFNFKTISIFNIVLYISKILIYEKIYFDKRSLFLIAKSSNGNLRDCINILQQSVLYTNNNIIFSLLSKMLNLVDELFLIKLLFFIFNNKVKLLIKFSKIIKKNGGNYLTILSNLIDLTYKISLLQLCSNIKFFEYKYKKMIIYFAKIINPVKINFFLEILISGYNNFNLFNNSFVNFILIMIKMSFFKPFFLI